MTIATLMQRAALGCLLALGLYAAPASATSLTTAIARAETGETCAQQAAKLGATELDDCGCPVKGCVRTQGYWGNKPGVIWPAPYDRDAAFFGSGLTWQEIMDSPTRGDAYLILAHQYIAAVLNRAAGASAPAAVQGVISGATAWFGSGVELGECRAGGCPLQRSWAAILDAYNNGAYPGAPKHCDKD